MCTRASRLTTSVSSCRTPAPTCRAWDTERLRFNDFHGAIGWKGVDQDLTVSVTTPASATSMTNRTSRRRTAIHGDAEAGFFAAGA